MSFTVTWTSSSGSHLAVVTDEGHIPYASSSGAQRQVAAVLRRPVLVRVNAEDESEVVDFDLTLQPGQAGQVEAALRTLPAALVTPDP